MMRLTWESERQVAVHMVEIVTLHGFPESFQDLMYP